MIYQLVVDKHGYHIRHLETGEYVGWLEPLKAGSEFVVRRAMIPCNEREKIAIVKSVDEAVPALADYNEKHPPQWMGGAKAKRYEKYTFYGVLIVQRSGPGEWTVERCLEMLNRDGTYATFATSDEAKRVAEMHLRDGFPNSKRVEDGLYWYNYRAPAAIAPTAIT